MAKLRWTDEATIWLEEIYRYLAAESPQAASPTVETVYDQAQILVDFPQIGYKHREAPEGEVRVLLYGHYRIAYLIDGNDSIDILGVFHDALEIEAYV
jgi:plasmid stabilization system protein ParE